MNFQWLHPIAVRTNFLPYPIKYMEPHFSFSAKISTYNLRHMLNRRKCSCLGPDFTIFDTSQRFWDLWILLLFIYAFKSIYTHYFALLFICKAIIWKMFLIHHSLGSLLNLFCYLAPFLIFWSFLVRVSISPKHYESQSKSPSSNILNS